MTKKYLIAIADICVKVINKNIVPIYNTYDFIDSVANECAKHNDKFNRNIFENYIIDRIEHIDTEPT